MRTLIVWIAQLILVFVWNVEYFGLSTMVAAMVNYVFTQTIVNWPIIPETLLLYTPLTLIQFALPKIVFSVLIISHLSFEESLFWNVTNAWAIKLNIWVNVWTLAHLDIDKTMDIVCVQEQQLIWQLIIYAWI